MARANPGESSQDFGKRLLEIHGPPPERVAAIVRDMRATAARTPKQPAKTPRRTA